MKMYTDCKVCPGRFLRITGCGKQETTTRVEYCGNCGRKYKTLGKPHLEFDTKNGQAKRREQKMGCPNLFCRIAHDNISSWRSRLQEDGSWTKWE